MTEKNKFVASTNGLSVVELNNTFYICLPRHYVRANGITKGTVMEYMFSGGIIAYRRMNAPSSDATTTEDDRKWSEIAALPPSAVRTIIAKIDELSSRISALESKNIAETKKTVES